MEQNRFVIITGMSGAGKTQVLRTLEDLNYFCVDNLPVMLLPKFIELSRQTPGRNTAMVIDARGGESFAGLLEIMDEMKANGFAFELLFLDADNAALIRRYKETRRRHPLLRKTLVLPCEIEKCICAFCSRKSLLAYFWSQKSQRFPISQSDCECFSPEDGCAAAGSEAEAMVV